MKTIQSMKGFLFYVAAVVFVTAAFLLLAGCMDPLGREATAPTGISVMNAPSAVTELDLTVSGPGMSTIQRTLTPSTSSITLEVPVGVNRVFDLTGGWFTFRRSFSVSPAGLSVPANMGSYIVVPDDGNARLVLVQNLSGSGWREIDYTIFEWSNMRVLGFDSSGRLILERSGQADVLTDPSDEVPSFIDGLSSFSLATLSPSGDSVFFATWSDGYEVERIAVFGEGVEPSYIGNYNGSPEAMAADDSGAVYFVGYGVGPNAIVAKMNPSGSIVATFASETVFPSGRPVDVSFFDGHIFVLNPSGPTGYKVLKFNTDLELVGHFGSTPIDRNNPVPGEFYGPWRFLATAPKNRLIVMDGDFPNGDERRRIVEFRDTNTSLWRTYGSSGSGEGQFSFFYC